MLISLVLSLLLSVSSAHAEEPEALDVPTVADDGPSNLLGLVEPAVVVTFDPSGCPVGYTPEAQFMGPGAYSKVMGATAQARATCVIAMAQASAIEARGEALLLEAQGDYNSQTLLAWAGAYAVRAAADAGRATYTNGEGQVSATGDAALVAAASNGSGGILPLGSYNYGVTAWNVTRPPVAVASPEAAPVTSSAPPSASVELTVEEIEDRLNGVVGPE